MAYKQKVAREKEVLAYFTSVMRGEVTSRVVRKDEVIDLPPTIAERMHAAEQLFKRYGASARAEAPVRADAPADMEALIRAMEGGA